MCDYKKEFEKETGLEAINHQFLNEEVYLADYVHWLKSQFHARDEELERLKAERVCLKEGCEHWRYDCCNARRWCKRDDYTDQFKPKEE